MPDAQPRDCMSTLRLSINRNLIILALIATTNQFIMEPHTALAQSRDEDGVTALMRAARDGEKDNVIALLEQGVDVNARDAFGWTALTYGAAKGDKGIVKALLEKGVDMNAGGEIDYSPLMAAAAYGRNSIIELLIEKGVDLNRKDKNGVSALDVANRAKQKKATEILKKAGAIERTTSASKVSDSSNVSVSTKPVQLNAPQPSYTTKARANLVEGNVVVKVLVGADGTVKKVRVLTGLPYGMSYQAMDAAYQLRFKPATKDGQAVAYWMSVLVEFHLRR